MGLGWWDGGFLGKIERGNLNCQIPFRAINCRSLTVSHNLSLAKFIFNDKKSV